MQQHMAEQALNCVLIFICTHTSMRTHLRTIAKHPLLLLLLYTDVNYQNEQNMFNVIDATRPMHAIYLACRVSLLGLALLLGFALLLGTSFSAASHWPGGTPSQEPVLNPHAHQRCHWSEVVVGKRPSAIISFASCHTPHILWYITSWRWLRLDAAAAWPLQLLSPLGPLAPSSISKRRRRCGRCRGRWQDEL